MALLIFFTPKALNEFKISHELLLKVLCTFSMILIWYLSFRSKINWKMTWNGQWNFDHNENEACLHDDDNSIRFLLECQMHLSFTSLGSVLGLKMNSQKNFYRHKKIVLKSSLKHKKFFVRPPRGSLEALKVVPVLTPHPVQVLQWIVYQNYWRKYIFLEN